MSILGGKNSLYCFCCKLFSQKDFKLISEGLNDWKNATQVLKSHENSPEHQQNMKAWKELEICLENYQAIDSQSMALTDTERRRWREVVKRIVAVIQSLAERNMALRGSTDSLFHPNKGNFMK